MCKTWWSFIGEHGIGNEKRELMCEMFNNDDIQQQISIKNSLDPSSLLNPGKVYPILRKCAEEGRLHIHARDKSKFSDILDFNLDILKPNNENDIQDIIKYCYKKIYL